MQIFGKNAPQLKVHVALIMSKVLRIDLNFDIKTFNKRLLKEYHFVPNQHQMTSPGHTYRHTDITHCDTYIRPPKKHKMSKQVQVT